MKREQNIQNASRLELSKQRKGVYWRVNVGRAWTGNKIERHGDGSITIHDPRPFTTGLPTGFPDTMGMTDVTITPEMVGQVLPVFTVIEFKTPTGKVSSDQEKIMTLIERRGGIAGVARSVDDAIAIVTLGAAR